MSFTFRPAKRENVGLMIGLIGATGSGKTYTAMRLASGMSGGKPFAVIDTEAGRAKHYADQFKFDHGDLVAPFRPGSYTEAIVAADEAGYPVIMVDSFSHEHAGDGGLLDWQEEELTRMAGDDWKRREACKMAAWIKPKMEHKRMVSKLLQVRAHLILCFRAEEKIEMVRGKDGKTQIVPKRSMTGIDGWVPICEKTLPYEMTASFLLLANNPGVPRPIKVQEQHRQLFPDGEQITEATGAALAAWASGDGVTTQETEKAPTAAPEAQEKAYPDSYYVAKEAAAGGTDALKSWWSGEGKPHQKELKDQLGHLKGLAGEADARAKESAAGPEVPFEGVDGGYSDAQLAADLAGELEKCGSTNELQELWDRRMEEVENLPEAFRKEVEIAYDKCLVRFADAVQ